MDIKSRQNLSHNLGELYSSAEPSPTEAIYLFLSLDLDNSTSLKEFEIAWPLILSHFYDIANHEIRKDASIIIELWKYIGDEILFYAKIVNMLEIEQCLKAFYQASETIASLINNLFPSGTKLAIKATSWLAEAIYMPPDDLRSTRVKFERFHPNIRNLIIQIPSTSTQVPQLDFIGPDIDVGFRISKFAHHGFITISAELARILIHKGSKAIQDNLRIIIYQQLKGVWTNRFYPIIWYRENWKDLNSLFQYDDEFTSEIVKGAIYKKDDKIRKERIDRPFRDLERATTNDALINKIAAGISKQGTNEINSLLLIEEKLEVHCVAVCFNGEGEVLIGKRPHNKSLFPDCWEFGCAQLAPKQEFTDCIRLHYKTDFGLEFDLISKHPFSSYFIHGKKVPGLVFFALAQNPKEVKKRNLSQKHAEIRWIDPLNSNLAANECIPDFHSTLKEALKEWEKWQNLSVKHRP